MQKKRAEWIVFLLVLAAAIFLGLNSQRYFTRFDLTASKQFTISKVSRGLFREIPDQVSITYFVSDKLRRLYSFPAQVEDLLNEYAAYSRGKIKVTVVDPASTDQTGAAEELGVYPQQVEFVEQNERSLARVYTGIVIQYLDRHKSIPVVGRTDTLEYDLTARIRQVVADKERVVGLLLGNPDWDLNSFQGLYQNLSGDFSLRPVEKGRDIPEDISVLLVLGNRGLDRFDLFPIDQYIMKGGKVLFGVEGVNIDFRQNLAASPLTDSPLLDMLEHYGVKVRRELVLDRYCKNFRQPRMVLGQLMWELMDKYPHWITIHEQDVSQDNPITARFGGLDLYWPSPLELVPRDKVKGEVIVKTTPQAWLMKDRFDTLPTGAAAMFATAPPETVGQYGLAATLSGSFSSWFKEIPRREGESRDWKEIRPTGAETRLLVVGDSDFASDFFQYTDAAYNLDFLSNGTEWLSNDEDLLGIRTRITHDLRLNKIRDPQTRLVAALATQLVNVVLVPLAVIGFGVFRFILRRKKKAGTAGAVVEA